MRPYVNVVDEHDVDLAHAEPLVALLQRTHGAVVAVVVRRLKIQSAGKRTTLDPFGQFGPEPAADFRRETNSLRGLPRSACPNLCSDSPCP